MPGAAALTAAHLAEDAGVTGARPGCGGGLCSGRLYDGLARVRLQACVIHIAKA